MPHHLLIADDSVTIQRVIKLTFADEDVDVVAVGDGSQALAAIDQAPPDIVLADVEMPGCSGYDVARHVRSSPRLSHIPVVLLTGAFEPVDEARASAAGCDGVLAKPFEPQAVLTRVRELLSKPRTAGMASRPGPALVPDAVQAPAPAQIPVPIPVQSAAVPPSVPVPVPPQPPMALSAESGPEPMVLPTPSRPKPSQDLDAYFERLDQAFADLATTPRPTPVAAPTLVPLVPELDALAAGLAATPLEPEPAPQPLSFSSARAARERMSELVPDLPAPPLQPVFQVAPPPAAGPQPVAAAEQASPEMAAGARSSRPGVRSLVEAFQGLIAEEQEAAPPAAPRPVVPSPAPSVSSGDHPLRPALVASSMQAGATPMLSDEAIDRIAARVIDRLAAQLGAGDATDIVSRIAERVVRSEIDQIKRRL